jgi:hypothetical protein
MFFFLDVSMNLCSKQGHFKFMVPATKGIRISADKLVATATSSNEWQRAFIEPLVSTEESIYVEFQLGSHTNVHIGVTALTKEPNDRKTISPAKSMQPFDCGLLGSGAKFCIVGLHIFHGNLFIYINGNIFESRNLVTCNLPVKLRLFVWMFGSGTSVRMVAVGSSAFNYEPPRRRISDDKVYW